MDIMGEKSTLRFLPVFILLLLSNVNIKSQVSTDEFKPSGKLWGLAFGDFFIKTGGDTATWAGKADYSGIAKKINAFSLRRMYLGYDYNISPVFSTSVVLEGGDGYVAPKGERTVIIKALNIRWKDIYKSADLVVGQIPTPTYSLITEKVWGYRSIEKTIADQRGIRSSTDFGVALQGKLDVKGNFGYNLMFANGSGTKPEDLTPAGKSKIVYGEFFGYLMDRKILVDLYGDFQNGLNHKNSAVIKGCLAYQTDPLTFGVEVLKQTQYHAKSDASNATPFGFSAWARGRITKDKLFAFARFDSYNPDNSYRQQDAITTYNSAGMSKHYDEQLITAGLDFTPHKNVHVMPNIWMNSYKAKATNQILVKRKADVVPRLTFYFVFR